MYTPNPSLCAEVGLHYVTVLPQSASWAFAKTRPNLVYTKAGVKRALSGIPHDSKYWNSKQNHLYAFFLYFVSFSLSLFCLFFYFFFIFWLIFGLLLSPFFSFFFLGGWRGGGGEGGKEGQDGPECGWQFTIHFTQSAKCVYYMLRVYKVVHGDIGRLHNT